MNDNSRKLNRILSRNLNALSDEKEELLEMVCKHHAIKCCDIILSRLVNDIKCNIIKTNITEYIVMCCIECVETMQFDLFQMFFTFIAHYKYCKSEDIEPIIKTIEVFNYDNSHYEYLEFIKQFCFVNTYFFDTEMKDECNDEDVATEEYETEILESETENTDDEGSNDNTQNGNESDELSDDEYFHYDYV